MLFSIDGKDVSRYLVRDAVYFDDKSPVLEKCRALIRRLSVPHIVCQRIVSHRKPPSPHIILMCGHDDGGLLAFSTVTSIVPTDKNDGLDLRYLMGLINSRPVSYYVHKFIYCNAQRSMDLYSDYLGRIPVPNVNAHVVKKISIAVKAHELHVQQEHRTAPEIDKYLVECRCANFKIRNYIEAADKRDLEIKDNRTVGTVDCLKVTQNGGWIDFKVDYHKKNSKAPISGLLILRLRPKSACMAEFIINEVQKAKSVPKKMTLFESVVSVPTAGFGKGMADHVAAVNRMLTPFLVQRGIHEAWLKEFIRNEKKIDGLIFDAFGLNSEERDEIMKNTRPATWINY